MGSATGENVESQGRRKNGGWDGNGQKLEIRGGEVELEADYAEDSASGVLQNLSWGQSARAGCWATELTSTYSAAQGIALICAPAQDTDQTNYCFFRDQYQINSDLSIHVIRSSFSGKVVCNYINEDWILSLVVTSWKTSKSLIFAQWC